MFNLHALRYVLFVIRSLVSKFLGEQIEDSDACVWYST